MGSLGSFGFVWFVRVCHLFRSGSFVLGIAGLIWVFLALCLRPCGWCVHSSLSGSHGCALCVAGFFRARLVHPGSPLVFVPIHPDVPWVRSVSFGWFSCPLWDTGFVRVSLVPLSAQWRSLSSFGFIWFVHVGPGGRWVRSGSSGSSGCAQGITGFFCVLKVRP